MGHDFFHKLKLLTLQSVLYKNKDKRCPKERKSRFLSNLQDHILYKTRTETGRE